MALGFLQRADLEAMLDRKYAILQQQANADTTKAAADAANARTAAERTKAQNALNFSQADLYGVQADELPANALSQRNLEAAQTGEYGIDTEIKRSIFGTEVPLGVRSSIGMVSGLRPEAESRSIRPYRLGEDEDETLGSTGRFRRIGLAKGIAKVPGKGSGKVDKVNAKLAPGEAVLNKAAAETLGRGMIASLNKIGARKLGLV